MKIVIARDVAFIKFMKKSVLRVQTQKLPPINKELLNFRII